MKKGQYITKERMIEEINNGATLVRLMEIMQCSNATVKNYLKKFKIRTPSGFYASGLPPKKRPPMSQEQKDLRSKMFAGENNPFYGKKHSDTTKQQMKENHADFTGDKNPFKNACKENPQLIENLRQRKVKEWDKLTDLQRRNRGNKSKPKYGEMTKYFWNRVLSNAKTRGIEIFVTPEEVWNLFIKQNKKCALTGDDINLNASFEVTASLDRKDSDKPYTLDNIQWIHKDINIMKWIKNQEQFIQICRKVINYVDSRTNTEENHPTSELASV